MNAGQVNLNALAVNPVIGLNLSAEGSTKLTYKVLRTGLYRVSALLRVATSGTLASGTTYTQSVTVDFYDSAGNGGTITLPGTAALDMLSADSGAHTPHASGAAVWVLQDTNMVIQVVGASDGTPATLGKIDVHFNAELVQPF